MMLHAVIVPLWIAHNRFVPLRITQMQTNPEQVQLTTSYEHWNSISTLFAVVEIFYSLTGEGLFCNMPILTPGMIVVHYVCSD